MRVEDSGFGVQGSGFRVPSSGFRVQVSGFRVQGSGFRVQSSGFRVQVPGQGYNFGGVNAQGLDSHLKIYDPAFRVGCRIKGSGSGFKA